MSQAQQCTQESFRFDPVEQETPRVLRMVQPSNDTEVEPDWQLSDAQLEAMPLQELADRMGIGRSTLRLRLMERQHLPRAEAIRASAPPGPGFPGSSSWKVLRWDEDPWAQDFVRCTDYQGIPEGVASFRMIAEEMGLDEEVVRREFASGVRKLRLRGKTLREYLDDPDQKCWWER